MIVTRKQIIHALRTENLQGGSWFEDTQYNENTGEYEKLNPTTCPVCAVGAVIRSTGVVTKKNSFSKLCLWAYKLVNGIATEDDLSTDTKEGIKTLLNEKNYLGALSVYFEAMADNGRIRRDRLVKFVKTHFPSQLRIN